MDKYNNRRGVIIAHELKMTKKTTTKTLALEKEDISVPLRGRKRQRSDRITAKRNDPVIAIDDDENESLSSVPSSLSSLAGSTDTTTIQPLSNIVPDTPQKISANNDAATTPLQSNVASTKQKKSANLNATSMDEIDVILPPSLFHTNDCTLMIQVEPNDASLLEFHGASGAVGRFEANDQIGTYHKLMKTNSFTSDYDINHYFTCLFQINITLILLNMCVPFYKKFIHYIVTMDLKGFQYSGTINPGPTAMVVSMHPMQSSSINTHSSGPIMKVESITDEFVTMSKAKDMMATFDAVVEKGDFDSSYFSKEIDVNAKQPNNKSKNNEINDINNDETNDEEKKKTPTKKKKTTTTTPTKKTKTPPTKKSPPKELKKTTKRKTKSSS